MGGPGSGKKHRHGPRNAFYIGKEVLGCAKKMAKAKNKSIKAVIEGLILDAQELETLREKCKHSMEVMRVIQKEYSDEWERLQREKL